MKDRIDFISEGKSGHVLYAWNNNTIRFYYELGGGNCVAIIYIPTQNEWLEKTRIPVEERLSVITLIAEYTIQKQAPNSHFFIRENCIEIMAD